MREVATFGAWHGVNLFGPYSAAQNYGKQPEMSSPWLGPMARPAGTVIAP